MDYSGNTQNTLAVDQQFFFSNIEQQLSQNITKKMVGSLAKLIVLDYNLRLKNKCSAAEHLKIVVYRLKLFLKNKVIDDENFSTIMILFIEAIKPENTAVNQWQNQAQNMEIIVDTLIASYFQEYQKDEQPKIKLLLINIINDAGLDKVFKFLKFNANIFKAYINTNLQKTTRQIDLPKLDKSISDLINKTNFVEVKITQFKQAAAKISLAFGALSMAAISVLSSSIMLPALLMPALLLTIRVAPKIGSLVGQAIIKADRGIGIQAKNIASIKKSFGLLQNIKKLLNHNIIPEITLKQQKMPKIAKKIGHLTNDSTAEISAQFTGLRTKTDRQNRSR